MLLSRWPARESLCMQWFAINSSFFFYFADVCSEHKAMQSSAIHTYVSYQIGQYELSSHAESLPQTDDITSDQVERICRWMTNPCKATGPDEVHPKLLAEGGPPLYELLAAIM